MFTLVMPIPHGDVNDALRFHSHTPKILACKAPPCLRENLVELQEALDEIASGIHAASQPRPRSILILNGEVVI